MKYTTKAMKKVTKDIQKRFELLKNFQKKWIAFNMDETKVLAVGNTTQEVDKKLAKLNERASIIEYVMPFDTFISPSNL